MSTETALSVNLIQLYRLVLPMFYTHSDAGAYGTASSFVFLSAIKRSLEMKNVTTFSVHYVPGNIVLPFIAFPKYLIKSFIIEK